MPKIKDLPIKYWFGGLLGGPAISVILEQWIIDNPPPWLVAIIYILGFGVYGLAIFLGYKQRLEKIKFLKYMVHTHEEERAPDGSVKVKDYGRIDENSVKMVEQIKDIL